MRDRYRETYEICQNVVCLPTTQAHWQVGKPHFDTEWQELRTSARILDEDVSLKGNSMIDSICDP